MKHPVLLVLSLLGALILGACESPAVGLSCVPGRTECSGMCVDLASDPANCGSCGNECMGQTCTAGRCTDPGFVVDDQGVPESNGCGLGQVRCGEECVLTDLNVDHCGGCFAACATGQFCVDGSCETECTAPRTECNGVCVTTSSNRFNCGSCGNVCEGEICFEGACSPPPAGHVVVIGHDYVESRPEENRILGNAVFLGNGAPVRVVDFQAGASSVAIEGVRRALAQRSAETGRPFVLRTAPAVNVTRELARAEVFLIQAQPETDDAELQRFGGEWQNAMFEFLSLGGVVVLLDGPSDVNGGTFQILEAAGLFAADTAIDMTGRMLEVVSEEDAVTLGVPRTFAAEPGTVGYSGVTAGVAVADGERAVVIHRGFFR